MPEKELVCGDTGGQGDYIFAFGHAEVDMP